MQYNSAKSIIYNNVCDVCEDKNFRAMAFRLATIDELETVIALLESELSCKKYKELEPHFQVVRTYLELPIHEAISHIDELNKYQKYELARDIAEENLTDLEKKLPAYHNTTLDIINNHIRRYLNDNKRGKQLNNLFTAKDVWQVELPEHIPDQW
jgi:hypothetical protein